MDKRGFCNCRDKSCPFSKDAQAISDGAMLIATTVREMCAVAGSSHKLNALGLLIAAKAEHHAYLAEYPDGDSFEDIADAARIVPIDETRN